MDGQSVVLGPGDLIGRLASAALFLDDGSISEAHAMVSLRGRELKLLGLRGLFAVGGQPTDEVVLQPGMVIEPARGLRLWVEDVVLPETLLAIEGDGLPRQVLTGTSSIVCRPRLTLVPRYHGDARANIWDNGEQWRIRVGDGPVEAMRPGAEWLIDGQRLRAVAVAVEQAAQVATRLDGAVPSALRIVTRFQTAHIYATGQPVVALDGIPARILSELVAFAGPVSWEVIAGEIWKEDPDRGSLRRRWDVSLARLRRKLREGHVRPDLVRAGGTGQVELLLYSGDRVEAHD